MVDKKLIFDLSFDNIIFYHFLASIFVNNLFLRTVPMSAAEAGQSQKKKVGISVSAVLLISFSANAFFY